MIKTKSVKSVISFRAARINFQTHASKNPWAVSGFIRIRERKEARDSRGTYAMRRSNSGDLWCHSLNSGLTTISCPLSRGRRVFQIRTYGDVQHDRILDQRAAWHPREMNVETRLISSASSLLRDWSHKGIHRKYGYTRSDISVIIRQQIFLCFAISA